MQTATLNPNVESALSKRERLAKEAQEFRKRILNVSGRPMNENELREYYALIQQADAIGLEVHRDLLTSGQTFGVNVPELRTFGPMTDNPEDIAIREARLLDGIEADHEKVFGVKEEIRQTAARTLSKTTRPAIITNGGGGRYREGELRSFTNAEKIARNTNGIYEGDFGRWVQSMVTGKWQGREQLRAMNTTTDSAGGYAVPDVLAEQFIDLIRNQSVALRAGAQTLVMEHGNLTMAKVLTGPTVQWLAENTEQVGADLTLGPVTMRAKTARALVKISEELASDSANAAAIIEAELSRALAEELDRVILVGSGSGQEPRGIFNSESAGVQSESLGENGAELAAYTQLIAAKRKVDTALGGEVANGLAMVMHPRTAATLASLVNGNGDWLPAPPYLANVRQFVTTGVPITQTQGTADDASSIIMGDFSQVVLGVTTDIRIESSNIPGFDAYQRWIRAVMRIDVALIRPNALCIVKGIIPAA